MRRALLVGIDDYPSGELYGCVRDAVALADLLAQHEGGAPNFECITLTGPPDPVTRATLRESIQTLLRSDADVALLYFAGHGTENDLGGYLVTQDAEEYDQGVPMTELLTWANDSPVTEIVIVLNCCHSGALGHVPTINNIYANIREGVSILTAGRSTEDAYESPDRGVFSELVCDALGGGASDVLGAVTVASVYAYVDRSLGAWQSRPLFKSHVAKLVPLRQCSPAVPLEVLRKLPTWFASPNDVFRLDPSFEPQADPRDAEHEEAFAELQLCATARVIDPLDEKYMYFAAMNSTGCVLTPLGRHLWSLARDKRI